MWSMSFDLELADQKSATRLLQCFFIFRLFQIPIDSVNVGFTTWHFSAIGTEMRTQISITPISWPGGGCNGQIVWMGWRETPTELIILFFFYILNRVSEFSPQSYIEVVRNKAIYYHRNFKPKGTNEVVLSKSSGQKGSGGSQTTLVLSMVSRIALALLRRSVLSFHHPHWGPLSITPFSYKDAIKMPHARPILRHAWVTTSQKNGKSEAHWVLLHLVTIATSLGCLT